MSSEDAPQRREREKADYGPSMIRTNDKVSPPVPLLKSFLCCLRTGKSNLARTMRENKRAALLRRKR